MPNWLLNKGVGYGIFWALLMNSVSALNDVLAKFLGQDLHFVEVAFFRFFFSTLTVFVALIWRYQRSRLHQKAPSNICKIFQTKYHGEHAIRGAMGAIAIGLCCFSVNKLPLADNSTILFADTLFMLPLSAIFLKEQIGIRCWLATIAGMVGITIMYRPTADHLNLYAIVPTVAALLFAIMNIMIKKMIEKQEDHLKMLFYFGLYTTILSSLFVPFYWSIPNQKDLYLLLALGIGSNLIQFFLFMAYRATRASVISTIRYSELPIEIILGYAFFAQIPDSNGIIGAMIIIATTYMMSHREKSPDNSLS
jgi:S-adenosylmethionine uptake transporter